MQPCSGSETLCGLASAQMLLARLSQFYGQKAFSTSFILKWLSHWFGRDLQLSSWFCFRFFMFHRQSIPWLIAIRRWSPSFVALPALRFSQSWAVVTFSLGCLI